MTPFDFVNSVTYTKKDLTEDDPHAIKAYVPFIVNKALSYFPDTLFYANEMNQRAQLDPSMQYRFYLNNLRKARRFSKWSKPGENDALVAVQKFYQYGHEKALRALALLSSEQIEQIKKKIAARGETNDAVRFYG